MKIRGNVDLGASFERLKTMMDEIHDEWDYTQDRQATAKAYAGMRGIVLGHISECTEPANDADNLKEVDIFTQSNNSQTETEILGEMEARKTENNMHPVFINVFEQMGMIVKPTSLDELAEYGNDTLPRKEHPRNTNNELTDDSGNGAFPY